MMTYMLAERNLHATLGADRHYISGIRYMDDGTLVLTFKRPHLLNHVRTAALHCYPEGHELQSYRRRHKHAYAGATNLCEWWKRSRMTCKQEWTCTGWAHEAALCVLFAQLSLKTGHQFTADGSRALVPA